MADEKFTGEPSFFVFAEPTRADVLRLQWVRHQNGDLTMTSRRGSVRLRKDSPAWQRWNKALLKYGVHVDDRGRRA